MGRGPAKIACAKREGKRDGAIIPGKPTATCQQQAGLIESLKEAGCDFKGEITTLRAHGEQGRDEASVGPCALKDHSPTGSDGKIKEWLDNISAVDLDAEKLERELEWWLTEFKVKEDLQLVAQHVVDWTKQPRRLEEVCADFNVLGFWRKLVVRESGIDEFGEYNFRPIAQATIRWMGKQKGQVAGFPA